jgi:hypothetical protein
MDSFTHEDEVYFKYTGGVYTAIHNWETVWPGQLSRISARQTSRQFKTLLNLPTHAYHLYIQQDILFSLVYVSTH